MREWIKLLAAIAAIQGAILLVAFVCGAWPGTGGAYYDQVELAEEDETERLIYLDTVDTE